MDQGHRNEEDLLRREIESTHRVVSFTNPSPMPLLRDMRRLPVAAHRLFGSRSVEKRSFGGDSQTVGRVETMPFDRCHSFSPALWVSGQGPIEGAGEGDGVL